MSDRSERHHIESQYGYKNCEFTYWVEIDGVQYRVPVFVLEDMVTEYPSLTNWIRWASAYVDPPARLFDDLREILHPAVHELQAYIAY